MRSNELYVEGSVLELNYIRYWLAGFKSAGGSIPKGSDETLRKAAMLMVEYAELIKAGKTMPMSREP